MRRAQSNQTVEALDIGAVEARLKSVLTALPSIESHLVKLQKGALAISSKSNEVDLVTEADLYSEKALLACLRSQCPDDGILSEEGNATASERSRSHAFQWVLDPIDGTVNYAHGLPIWAISIALLHHGKPVAGIVAAPAMGERFCALRGRGAQLNGKPIQVNECARMRAGLVATGFPYDRAIRAEPLSRALANMLRVSGGVRRLGAAALDICYVANGRFSAYYEMGLKPWDVAAAGLILREAGGKLTDHEGKPHDLFHSPACLASNGRVHNALLEAAAPLNEALAIKP